MNRFLGSIQFASAACAMFLCLAINPAAQAALPRPDKELVRSVPVPYGDLDLTRQADAHILLVRIEKAAYRACGGNPRLHPSYRVMPGYVKAVFKECREDAIARAISSADMPALLQARAAAATGNLAGSARTAE